VPGVDSIESPDKNKRVCGRGVNKGCCCANLLQDNLIVRARLFNEQDLGQR